jgi:mannose-6-phosphate isomerase-like protein (cupin superfamily)
MKGWIRTAIAAGVFFAPLAIFAQSATVDHLSQADLLEKGKAFEQAAAASGTAGTTLAKYPNHFTMLTVRTKDGGAELHRHFADFFYVVRGGATLVSGGSIPDPKESNPGEVRGTIVKDGTQTELHEGDFVHIPAGVPHQLLIPKGGELLYFVIKVQEN